MHQHQIIKRLERYEIYFRWLRWFYPSSKGITFVYLIYFFFPQKILRVNGRVPWPVHFTSRVQHPNKIRVGNRTAPGMNSGCYIQGRNGIKIGSNVRVGPNVGIISANHNVNDFDKWSNDPPIEIGDNVWIGMNTVILPGARIGSNVIIGANSVVVNKIPSNSIAIGSPCKVLKPKGPYKGYDYSKL